MLNTLLTCKEMGFVSHNKISWSILSITLTTSNPLMGLQTASQNSQAKYCLHQPFPRSSSTQREGEEPHTCCASSLVGRTTRARTWQTTRSSRTCQSKGRMSSWKQWGEKEVLVSKEGRRDGLDTSSRSFMFLFYFPPPSQLLVLCLHEMKGTSTAPS